MGKIKYDPRPCIICGTMFVPFRKNITTCDNPECKYKAKLERQKRWYKENYTRAVEGRRLYMRRVRTENHVEKKRKPKPDTIVAIGYADRQREETLKMVGRVNTEL